MTLGVVGTPANIANGGSYTREAGANRLVIAVAMQKSAAAYTLTNIVYNSVTRTPTVQANDTLRDTVGICIFKESELPAGAATLTATWSTAPTVQRIVCYTVEDADQGTTVRNTNTATGNGTAPSVTLASITVGDLVIGGTAHRASTAGFTTGNSFTEVYDASNGEGGQFHSAYKIAVGTSETYSLTGGGSDDWVQAILAIIPYSAGSNINLLGGKLAGPFAGKL